ncbi:U32 family peptidase [Bacteriovoracaceae bacterium]|nr:U32 family peptidase [Bacteriovoracaceae bacterium]
MELLIPAGNMNKLKSAVQYGANAVYLSGQNFGLREASDNFSLEQLREAVEYCHAHQVKSYITLNGFLHDEDILHVKDYVNFLNQIKADALIISDLGLISFISEFNLIPIHLSTQASCLNSSAGQFWKKHGVKRLILGRETSLAEASEIKRDTGLEVELFIHGSMCMSYSGNCTISNFTQGRDSNRGGCAQSCRFEYSFKEVNEKNNEDKFSLEKSKSYFMSSKDLNGIDLIPEYYNYKIDSVKVEGRMKSEFYAGLTAKAYREAIDLVGAGKTMEFNQRLPILNNYLNKYSHRSYTHASLLEKAQVDSIYDERESEVEGQHNYVGKSLGLYKDNYLMMSVKKKFTIGCLLEFHLFSGENVTTKVGEILDLDLERIEKPKPSSVVLIPLNDKIPNDVLISLVHGG